MQGFLYKLMFHNEEWEYPVEKEFIIAANDIEVRDVEVIRIQEWYEENLRKPFDHVFLSPPLVIEDRLYNEEGQMPVDWQLLRNWVQEQDKKRPREISCIFRGPSSEEPLTFYEPDMVEEIRDSIRYFMDDHRVEGDPFVFVGSTWDSKTRLRKDKVSLFEAAGIELAADLVQLHYLGPMREITLTEWCCPIYFV
jgi:hypothetical protein